MDVSALRYGVASGTAVYAFSLARALLQTDGVRTLTLYFAARESDAAHDTLEELRHAGAEIIRGPAPWRWSPDGGWWLPQPSAHRLFRTIDVFHAGESFFPRRVPVPTVATVHDLTDVLFPEQHMRWNRWRHARRLRWIEAHAHRVIAVSDATRNDLARLTRIPEARIDRVYEARGLHVHDAPLRQLDLPDAPCIVTVGTLEPRKNHIALVRAFEALPSSLAHVRLVLAGARGWRAGPIMAALSDSPAAERIHWLGAVDAPTLEALYRRATVFAYPSLYEGFGLPVLEAMAAGTPVVTSNRSSLPEVAGDAALLVDPHSVTDLRDALARLLSDGVLHARLAAAGRARAQRFTWLQTARETVRCYRRALEAVPDARALSTDDAEVDR